MYSDSNWRNHAAPIIRQVLADYPAGPARRKALREAYPYGQRKYHPYKIWLDEVARQEGRKPKLGSRLNVYGKAVIPSEPDPRQDALF